MGWVCTGVWEDTSSDKMELLGGMGLAALQASLLVAFLACASDIKDILTGAAGITVAFTLLIQNALFAVTYTQGNTRTVAVWAFRRRRSVCRSDQRPSSSFHLHMG